MAIKKKLIIKEHDIVETKYGIGTVIHVYKADNKFVVVELADYIRDTFIGDIFKVIHPKK
jgi:hypothetical protein